MKNDFGLIIGSVDLVDLHEVFAMHIYPTTDAGGVLTVNMLMSTGTEWTIKIPSAMKEEFVEAWGKARACKNYPPHFRTFPDPQ